MTDRHSTWCLAGRGPCRADCGCACHLCENAASSASGAIVAPGCSPAGRRQVSLTVSYDRQGISSDVLDLCRACARLVAADARRHGYEVARRSIR